MEPWQRGSFLLADDEPSIAREGNEWLVEFVDGVIDLRRCFAMRRTTAEKLRDIRNTQRSKGYPGNPGNPNG